MRKTYKYRLYPTAAQAAAFEEQLGEACRLYNAALQERRDAYQRDGRSPNYYYQANQLKDIRAAGELGLANFSASQDVLRRVDKTFKAFFRRVKAGQKAGYPRFKSRRRFDSYTFPSYGDGSDSQDHACICKGSGISKSSCIVLLKERSRRSPSSAHVAMVCLLLRRVCTAAFARERRPHRPGCGVAGVCYAVG